MTWEGDEFEEPPANPDDEDEMGTMAGTMDMLYAIRDRRVAVLIQPSIKKPLILFGRLDKWTSGVKDNNPEKITMTMKTEGVGQVVID